MSHANGLSPFRGKVNQFIIPLSHFKGQSPVASAPQESVVAEPPAEYATSKENQAQLQSPPPTPEKKQAYTPPKINIKKPATATGVSSLSLSSIGLKKEAERRSSSKKIAVNEAEEKFTQETLSTLWKSYREEKNNLGENNIAALLEMSQPELMGDHKILLKTSSSLSKVELTKELTPLMAYLSEALNNYKITFEIKVETQKSESYVYGVKDKYEYLKKINPDIEVLKNEFDLDL
jgi:DNA polymerase-3 subunit gamma/tau